MPELSLPPPAVQPLLREGEALGVWRVRAAMHRCERGQWYRARHALDSERCAAVLVMPRNERSAGVLLRYGDLAGELDQIRHPAVAVPSDSGVTAGGQPYLIVEWTGGKPLTQARAKLGLRDRLSVLLQLCELLRHVHQQGWLLAEIDPTLLWIGPDQHLTLIGLGLVRMPDPHDPFERGMSPGTAAGYLAPELAAGGPPSLSTEVFGLGALLCMLVDGRLPRELGASFEDASLASAWPALSPAERLSLDALLHKAASPLSAQRHASAEALADDLRAWLSGKLSHSALAFRPMPVVTPGGMSGLVPESAAAPQAAEVAAPAFAAESAVAPWPPAPRRRGLRVAVASVALASLAVGVWASRQDDAPAAPAAAVSAR